MHRTSQSYLARQNRAQQEMVGFILIIILVMIGGLVFFVMSVKNQTNELQSTDLNNFMSSILEYTTDCAPVIVPQYLSLSDLIKACYEDNDCTNLKKGSCEYLNETLTKILIDFTRTRGDIEAYQLDLTQNTSSDYRNLIEPIKYGNCSNSKIFYAEQKIRTMDSDSVMRLRICKIE